MKKALFVLLAALIVTCLFTACQQDPADAIIGTWKYSGDLGTSYFTLTKDNTFTYTTYVADVKVKDLSGSYKLSSDENYLVLSFDVSEIPIDTTTHYVFVKPEGTDKLYLVEKDENVKPDPAEYVDLYDITEGSLDPLEKPLKLSYSLNTDTYACNEDFTIKNSTIEASGSSTFKKDGSVLFKEEIDITASCSWTSKLEPAVIYTDVEIEMIRETMKFTVDDTTLSTYDELGNPINFTKQ